MIKGKTKQFLLILAFILGGMILFASCDDAEPVNSGTIPLDKHGAIEMNVKTIHVDTIDVLKIEKIVYNKDGVIVSKRFFLDTMKSLGSLKDTMNTGRVYVDDDGNEHELDTVIIRPKLYNIYITVK